MSLIQGLPGQDGSRKDKKVSYKVQTSIEPFHTSYNDVYGHLLIDTSGVFKR